jgi:hypothetical protein
MLDEANWDDYIQSVMAPLLPFHREMLQQMLEADGLCVMSSGLGWHKVSVIVPTPWTLMWTFTHAHAEQLKQITYQVATLRQHSAQLRQQ